MSDERILDSNTATALSLRSWAKTKDRSARTAAARKASRQRFVRQAVEIHGEDAAPEVIQQAAELLELAFMREMAAKGAKARKDKAAARRAQAEVGEGE